MDEHQQARPCVLGLDPSLTGFATVAAWSQDDYQDWWEASKPRGKAVKARIARVLPLVDHVMQIADTVQPHAVVIEGYSYGSNAPGLVERVELGGILRADLLTLGVPVYEVAPNSLKKFVTGKGVGGKVAVIAAATKRWGVAFGDSDRYDAFGLAMIGLCVLGLREPENEAQRQVIATVRAGATK